MNRTRILFVSKSSELYGAEQSLFQLAVNLDRNVFEPTVVCPSDGPLKRLFEENGIPCYVIPDFSSLYPIPKSKLLSFIHHVWGLFRVLRHIRPDLVHINIQYSVKTWGLACLLARVPYVVHIRAESWLSVYEKLLVSLASQIICVSAFLKQKVLEVARRSDIFIRIQSSKVHVIYNGRPIEQFVRIQSNDHSAPFTVALIGCFDRNKGQDRFVLLAEQVLRREPRVRFLIVGDVLLEHNRGYMEEVTRLISEKNLGESVIIKGFQAVKEILPEIDVVVSLSETEGLGNVLIEAMVAGRVVIANNAGGLPEVVGDENAGFLVEKNDLSAMEDIICELLHDEFFREKVGSLARLRAGSLFAMQKHVQHIVHIYASLLGWGDDPSVSFTESPAYAFMGRKNIPWQRVFSPNMFVKYLDGTSISSQRSFTSRHALGR